MSSTDTDIKLQALALHLDIDDVDEIEETAWGSFETLGGEEYRIYNDSDADDAAEEYIRESVWAFVPGFVQSYVPDGIDCETIATLQERCEDANPAILALIGDQFEEFVSDAISSDGRGHFIASYDFAEDSVDIDGETFYVYRVN